MIKTQFSYIMFTSFVFSARVIAVGVGVAINFTGVHCTLIIIFGFVRHANLSKNLG